MSRLLQLSAIGDEYRDAWESAVRENPACGFMQSLTWAELQARQGVEVYPRLWLRDGRIEGGAIFHAARSLDGPGILVTPGGPLVPWHDPPLDLAATAAASTSTAAAAAAAQRVRVRWCGYLDRFVLLSLLLSVLLPLLLSLSLLLLSAAALGVIVPCPARSNESSSVTSTVAPGKGRCVRTLRAGSCNR